MSATETIAVYKDGARVVIDLENLEARKAQGWKVEPDAEAPAEKQVKKTGKPKAE